jgi:hypothetical protein
MRSVALGLLALLLLGSPGCTVALWRNLGQTYPDPPARVVGARSVRAWRDAAGFTAEVTAANGMRSTRVVTDERAGLERREVAVQVVGRDASGRALVVELRDGADVRRLQVGVLEDAGRPVAPFVAGVLITPVTAALDVLGFPVTLPLLLLILSLGPSST